MQKLFKNKFVIFFISLMVIAGLGAGLAIQQKYYVKKFIKSHPFLYSQAMKVAVVKNAVEEKLFGKKEPIKLRHIDVDKENWHLVFDAAQSLGQYQRFWGDIGFESFKSGILLSKSRELFEFMRETNKRVGDGSFEQNAFRYIRAHNLFSNGEPPWGEGLDIYQVDASGQVSYNWKTADQVFDRILAYGFKPIIEFGFMPDALASIPDRRQQWGRANISPPKDYKEWQNLVYHTVKHFVERYGAEEIRKWYFEVWNEPDLGWLFWVEDPDPRRNPYGDMAEYHKLYDYTVLAAKSALPTIHIGGPASAGGGIDRLLEHVYLEADGIYPDNISPIDFVSSHAYGEIGFDYRQHHKKSLLGKIFWKLNSSVEHPHEKIREKIKTLPFILSETGPKLKNRIVNQGRYMAAWYAKMVDAMFYLGDSLGRPFQPEEVVYWSAHQVTKEFNLDRGGIATALKSKGEYDIFKLPIYNVFEALGYLSKERIAILGTQFGDGVHAIATRDGHESLELLVYHLNEDVDETQTNSASSDSVRVAMTIENLPFAKFEVRQYAIDGSHSNTYAVWKSLGSPKHISKKERDLLVSEQNLSFCAPTFLVDHTANSFDYNFNMQKNSVRLIILKKVE